MKLNRVIIVISILLIAFIGGIFVAQQYNLNSSAEDKELSINGYKNVLAPEKMNAFFPSEYYSYNLFEENETIGYIECVCETSKIPEQYRYKLSNVLDIMRKTLGIQYDIEKMSDSDTEIILQEYKDDLPTGKQMSAIADDSGIVYMVFFRIAEYKEQNPDQFVSMEKVYNLALEKIADKYNDKKIELKNDFEPDNFEIYYNPQKQGLCYKFEIVGAIDGKWDDELSRFSFYPIVNVYDENDMDIASTFGY